jgi:hypothetical protein
VKTKTDKFIDAFDTRVAEAEQAYAEAHRSFVDLARSNPADAVRYGEGVLVKQRVLSALRYTKLLLTRVGDEYPTRLAAVNAAANEFRDAALREAASGRSGSDLANGANHAEVRGLYQAIGELERLSFHESING